MAVAQSVLSGLGYAGTHFALLEARDARDLAALDAALRAAPAQGVAAAATFAVQAGKRETLELALAHVLAHAPRPQDEIALPAAGAPFRIGHRQGRRQADRPRFAGYPLGRASCAPSGFLL